MKVGFVRTLPIRRPGDFAPQRKTANRVATVASEWGAGCLLWAVVSNGSSV